MVDRALRTRPIAIVLALPIALGGWSGVASAGLIASDFYGIGTSPSSGQYQAGSVLMTQPSGLTTLGFANGGYTGGSGTSQYGITSGGLSYPPIGIPPASDGKVTVTASAIGSGYKSVARNLSPAIPSSSSYFFSMLVRSDGVASVAGSGYVLAGFGNTVHPDPGPTSGYLAGIYIGFGQVTGRANDTGDLILRYRTPDLSTTPPPALSSDAVLVDGSQTNTVGQTYLVVAELDVNSRGSFDRVSYWVNPTQFDNVGTLTASSLTSGSFDSLSIQGPGDLSRLTFAETNWNAGADFDQMKMGTTLADVVPSVTTAVPEPGSLLMVGLGLLGGLGVRLRRRARD